MPILLLVLVVLWSCTAGAFAQAPAILPTAPSVVETTPTLEARDVDTSLTEIVVRFDRPMQRTSWSWCGGGVGYPNITGKPFFRDEFTAVLPVALEPEHTYMLGINCPSAQGFRSAEDIAVAPKQLRFTTNAGTGFVPAQTKNFAAWEEFRKLFTERYSYVGRTGIDWEQRFAAEEEWMLRSPTVDEFATRLAVLLGPADDPHLYLRLPNGNRVSTHLTRGVPNSNPAALKLWFADAKAHNGLIVSARRDDIGYIAINGWESPKKELDVLDGIMAEMKSARVLIVDVRANGGGGEDLAGNFAAWFQDAARVYSLHRYRDPSRPSGWGEMRQRFTHINPEEKRFHGRVLLLQGTVCLSSNESFILMMKQSPRVTTIGVKTRGSSGNPKSYPLPNGLTIIMPRWEDYLPDGTLMEGKGIVPDITVEGSIRSGDPVLKRAWEEAQLQPSPTPAQ